MNIPLALILTATCALLVVTGLKKQPGIGIIGAVAIAALILGLRHESITSLGFQAPANWLTTLLGGLGLGVIIQIGAILLIEPLSEKLTRTRHDHSVVDAVKGNWMAFVQWLIMVWVLVAVLEEGLYRGFLMTEMAELLGKSPVGLAVNVLVTSIVFGLSHGYQNRSGILSTGIVGVFLALIFVLNGFNLWLVIFTHGFIDTVGIGLIAIDGDKYIREKIWKTAP